jgi:hypothetical protein
MICDTNARSRVSFVVGMSEIALGDLAWEGEFAITVIPLDASWKSSSRQHRHDLRKNKFAFVHETCHDKKNDCTDEPHFKSLQVDFRRNLL